jgi:hypothetical protein
MQPDRIEIGLLSLSVLTAIVWGALEAHYKPFPPRARAAFMWISFIEIAVATFWETQHGKFFYP